MQRGDPQSGRIDRWAQLGAAVAQFAVAVLVFQSRYGHIRDPLGAPLFWDSKVLMAGGLEMAQGRNPYLHLVWHAPFPLVFVSPPALALVLGATARVLREHLFDVLAVSHVVALIVTPLVLTRQFLGRTWTDIAFGYGLFVCAFGAWGVTTIVSGNFGSTLYLLIFMALFHALRTSRWMAFHIAVAFACQVKLPFALFWAVPVMRDSLNWTQLRHAVIAASVATIPFAISYLAAPAFFAGWLAALAQQVSIGDAGYSMYGVVFSKVWLDTRSLLPLVAHSLVGAGLLVFLLLDRTRGQLRVAALIVFIILANPRMKEYDIAFATIPAAILYLTAMAPAGSSAPRRAWAIAALLGLTVFILKAYRTPAVGAFIYVACLIGAILSLRVKAAIPKPLEEAEGGRYRA
jgi:hypothetical protein